MSDLSFIENAFATRPRPEQVRDMTKPTDEILADADAFTGMDWRNITCDMLDKHFDAVHGFSPAAFCYYLPGIFSAGIRESRPDLLVNNALITTLDRGNEPSFWDDFFRARWLLLTPQELEATQRWILWLEEFDPPPFSDASLTRAYDTIHLLAHRSGAAPITT